MRPGELEFKVLGILERVEKGMPLEDSQVECKAEWPTCDAKTARQLGGHANAARGQPVLWLFGVDEKAKRIPGVATTEFSDWYAAVRKHFEEAWAPDPECSINVSWKGVTVRAVLFETNRAPYVRKNSEGGAIQFEVPWREADSTRTAKRRDLLRLLVPLQKMPELEITSANLNARKRTEGQHGDWAIRLDLDVGLYILTRDNSRITIPGHRSTFSIGLVSHADKVFHRKVEFPKSTSMMLETGPQLAVDGPTYFSCRCELSTSDVLIPEGGTTDILLRLRIAELERDVELKATLAWAPDRTEYRQQHPEYLGDWRYQQSF